MGGGATAPVQDVSVSDLTQVNTTTAAPEDWPATLDEDAAADSSVCAVLGESSSSGMARTTLASADQIESGGVKVTGGTGALVRASAGGGIGPVFLITDAGRARGLSGTLSDTLARLGYEEGSVVAVPAAWLALFPTGVELSTEAVWDGVSETGQPTPEPTPEPTPRSRLTTTRSRAARRGGRRSSPRPPPIVSQIGMERAWSLTRGGDVTVAVVDSGIAEANPHFDGALAAGVDLTRAGGATEDASGQGTAVAGAIGARSVSGSGLVGLASEATPSSALATRYAGASRPWSQRPIRTRPRRTGPTG